MRTITMFLVVTAALAIASCGGPPQDEPEVSVYADMEATQGWAREQGFKYCNIQSDRVCQSPDSVLHFKMPQKLHDAYIETFIQERMTILNDGNEPVFIEAYYMTAVDDSNHLYEAVVEAPGRFENTDRVPGGLQLSAHDKIDLQFSLRLRGLQRTIEKLTFWYKLEDRPDTSRVVVSYRPSSLRDARERRTY